jgi:hypothetical protein
MLNSFFGGKKDRTKKKKKLAKDKMTAAPSPPASPESALPEATTTPTPAMSP